MSVSFDALNLNNPSLKYYQSASIPSAFYSNGRQYYLNFRFKY
jgi:iron complex outermembrane receptor protein